MSDSEELHALVEIIVGYHVPKNILLFGSRARGLPSTESDIDLCVLYDHLPKRSLEVLQDLYKRFFAIQARAVDLVVYETAQFNERSLRRGSLEQAIRLEGQVVYG